MPAEGGPIGPRGRGLADRADRAEGRPRGRGEAEGPTGADRGPIGAEVTIFQLNLIHFILHFDMI